MSAVFVFALLITLRCVTSVNVHIVPHTHDDVGWLKTVDQLYLGANSSIQHAGVQYILDSVIAALQENPERKFVYVEQAFFQLWWMQQTDDMHNIVRGLVKSGQLEFINGGWCMHDEAAAHYVDMIDQTTIGHKFILDEFGADAAPTVGWQVDPFGHSSTQAALMTYEMGLDGLFFMRSDYEDQRIRESKKAMEVIWRASESLGADAQVFTGAFISGYGYGAPSGFDWDLRRSTQRIIDDPRLEDNNVEYFVNLFNNAVDSQAARTNGDNVMWTMGGDFQHENANSAFKELDKLIKYVNMNGTHHAFYSTPSIYVAAKNKEELSWPLKTDDYFPYGEGADNYWTGYFSSRPALKRYIRIGSAFLQVARQLNFFTRSNSTDALWQAQGIAQHHDAVSGTSKQHVAYDYAKRISIGMATADAGVEYELSQWTVTGHDSDSGSGSGGGDAPTLTYCPLANISHCPPTQQVQSQSGVFVIILYNPIARNRSELIRIPVNTTFTVVDSNGMTIPSQMMPVMQTIALQSDAAPYVLEFIADVPGLGFTSYFAQQNSEVNVATMAALVSVQTVRKHDKNSRVTLHQSSITTIQQAKSISNNYWRIDFDVNTQLISSITDLTSGHTRAFNQSFWWYLSYQGSGMHSGAYVFRPADSSSADVAIPLGDDVITTVTSNTVTSEARQVFKPWLTQIVRLIHDQRHIEFEWTVGHIPIDDDIGKEIITRFYLDEIMNDDTFWTDSNGREFIKRRINYRPTWNLTVTQPVAGNYYPADIGAYLDDGNSMMYVLNDRAQGCSSLHEGELEFMIHRRLVVDDGRGVGEPLNETDSITGANGRRIGLGLVVTGSHYVFIGESSTLPSSARPFANRLFQAFHATYSPLSGSIKDYVATHTVIESYLKTALPHNIEVMSIQPWYDQTHLLRLSHQFGVREGNNEMNQNVTIDLSNLLTFPLIIINRLTLSANQIYGRHRYYTWNIQRDDDDDDDEKEEEEEMLTKEWKRYARDEYDVKQSSNTITLHPLEIVTLQVQAQL